MRPFSRSTLSLIALLTLAPLPSIAQTVGDGLAAYNRQDYVTAYRNWRPLADQGTASAQHNLGVMYRIGLGVPQDYAAAVSWYRGGADQGTASAQYNLGVMYLYGQGVGQDYVQAYKWFTLSASRATRAYLREERTRQRDIVAARMTPQQITEAQRLAREWKPK